MLSVNRLRTTALSTSVGGAHSGHGTIRVGAWCQPQIDPPSLVLSYQRRIHAVKHHFFKRGIRTPLGRTVR